MIQITPEIAIDESEIQLEFVRSSGPGGQNVNKVATAAQLRFDAVHSPALPPDVRERLMKIAKGRINKDGILVIDAQRFRTQGANREDAIDRLINLVRKATEKPRPRVKTKPTKASKERRLESKRRRGAAKKLRSGKPELED